MLHFVLARACIVAIALGSIACCSGKAKRPPEERARPVAFGVTPLGEPVRGARTWITALAPNARGGWNFLTQTYEYQSELPSELVVLDLATGKQTSSEGPPGIYANSNYAMGELRAANGRVFFPMLENQLAYYDPKTEALTLHGKLFDGPDKAIYRMVFGPDGMLYGGTQANGLPAVFMLDPDTLQVTLLGRVGKRRQGYSYAYYLAADPPWLYVAVGELPWELVALNIQTGEQRVLATRADEGFVEFEHRPEGIAVKLVSGLRTQQQRTDVQWCVDGKLVAKPGRPRNVKPTSNPIYDAPALELSAVNPDANGIGRVRYRIADGDWRAAEFRVKHTTPVPIESLVGAGDGTLLGSARQYHGFFRYDPRDRRIARLEPLGVSGGPRVTLGSTTYISGYPNGVLYAYDATQPWSLPQNPRTLGTFAEAGAHYASFLAPGPNGRLYYAGRRERTGTGGGIGAFDPATEQFTGHHTGLETLEPSGLAVVGDRIVYAGRVIGDAAGPAELVVYDANLRERDRMIVRSELRSTGQVFATAAPNLVIGYVPEAHAIYQFDLAAKQLVVWLDLPGPPGPVVQRETDHSLWYAAGDALYRLDTKTLEETRVGQLPAAATGADLLVWLGDRLYWASGSKLFEIAAPTSR